MKHRVIGLIGNPNCGKTTLFNALTGSSARVGNWPGVTVECKRGTFKVSNQIIEVVDLPGIYSLNVDSGQSSLDERIAAEYVLSSEANLIVNVVDASNLERNLYLTTQLLEMNLPVVIALNMQDVARSKGLTIHQDLLSKTLGCQVVSLQSNKGIGIDSLKQHIFNATRETACASCPIDYGASLNMAMQAVTQLIYTHLPDKTSRFINSTRARWLSMRLLEEDLIAWQMIPLQVATKIREGVSTISGSLEEDADILFADARYVWIDQVIGSCVLKTAHKTTMTEHIDRIVLNRWLGIPIFLCVMYAMFFFAINVGGAFQDFFDISSSAIFIHGTSQLLMKLGAPAWFIAILAEGIGTGINTTITFIPVIGGMFLFLSLLEDSGYMARAAFVMDRFMRAIGLPGKSFVPMIVGFGCNVPAVMAARTLENPRDRILTILMTPFMSCGARLAIFAVFTAAFFPQGGQNIVFALYLIGVIAAIVTGLILRASVLKGATAPLILELPAYHLPHTKSVFKHTWHRLKKFLFKAGKMIIPICVLIGALNSITTSGHLVLDPNTHTLLSQLGRFLTPLFAPLGLHQDNWPATVGLMTGVLAKEVVVATLNTLYTQVGHLSSAHTMSASVLSGLSQAFHSIFANLANLKHALMNPVLASAAPHDVNHGVFGQMYLRFNGQVGAFAYLLFVLLYFPCVSTTAVMARELSRGWAIFAMCWSTMLAYAVAVIFYQAATFSFHPISASVWIAVMLVSFLGTTLGLKVYAHQHKGILSVQTNQPAGMVTTSNTNHTTLAQQEGVI